MGILLALSGASLLLVAPQTAHSEVLDKKFAASKPFSEVCPQIDDVQVKLGDPFVEVFVMGTAAKECFDQQEYHVVIEADRTLIIPRFRNSNPEVPCKTKGPSQFTDKAADLDPNHPATGNVSVLSFQGWIHRKFDIASKPNLK